MVTVTVYVEGGGNDRTFNAECRKGFRLFFEKSGFKGRMPGIVACGSREDAYDRFRTAVEAPRRASSSCSLWTAKVPLLPPSGSI